MKLFRSLLAFTTITLAAFATVHCGGLSPECQKALDCCTAVQSAEGQTGDELKLTCQTSTGGTSSLTVTCGQVNQMNSAGSLGVIGCSSMRASITSALSTCKKTTPAACQ